MDFRAKVYIMMIVVTLVPLIVLQGVDALSFEDSKQGRENYHNFISKCLDIPCHLSMSLSLIYHIQEY